MFETPGECDLTFILLPPPIYTTRSADLSALVDFSALGSVMSRQGTMTGRAFVS